VVGLTRRALEDLRRAYGLDDDAGKCSTCRGVCIAGAPGLFAVAYRGSEILSHEEARSFFYGCPSCGADVKTYPIVMRRLSARHPIPHPWPIHEWPEHQGPPERQGNVYYGGEAWICARK
jgi:hypothetical protein